jgi:sn-glycerol 3-phosphate transport system ATP-binding protein
LQLVNGSVPGQNEKDVILGTRPEHFELAESEEEVLHLRVDHVELLGADTLVHGDFGEDKNSLTVRLPDVQQFDKHTILPLVIPPPKLHLFDIESGKRIGK